MPYLYTNTTPPQPTITMNTPETAAPLTPETLPVKVSILSRWIDYTEPTRPTFHFKLELTCEDRTMQTDYSGGILAFIPAAKRKQWERSDRGSGMFVPSYVANLMRGTKYNFTSKDTGHDSPCKALEFMIACAEITAASVCYSLILDGQSGEDTFADFCSELGYDEDSRSALATYEACQKSGAAFRKLVGSHYAAIAEALQDY